MQPRRGETSPRLFRRSAAYVATWLLAHGLRPGLQILRRSAARQFRPHQLQKKPLDQFIRFERKSISPLMVIPSPESRTTMAHWTTVVARAVFGYAQHLAARVMRDGANAITAAGSLQYYTQ